MNLNDILRTLKGVKGNGDKYTALCPSHEDKNSSLSISEDRGKILIHCHAGCSTESIVNTLGLKMNDLFIEEMKLPKKSINYKNIKPEAEYLYYDLTGNIAHKTIRYGKQYEKPFGQARPDPNKQGAWIHNLKDTKTIIYKLPQVVEGIKQKKPIFIVEGEKDCDNLEKLGFIATTSPMGAGKWKDYYSAYLENSIVYIIPDNDEIGKNHAEQVAKSLLDKAKSVKILDITKVYPELPPKGDITDFFQCLGKTKGLELLNALMKTSEQFKLSISEVAVISRDEKLSKLYNGTEYFVKNVCLCRSTSDGEKTLANFVPIPISTITKSDGININTYFKLSGISHKGKPLREICVPAKEFTSMNWIISEWGFEAPYTTGNSVKDHIRNAISLAGDNHAKKENVYTYTGWCKVNDKYIYLYNGGAIGGDNISVELDESLSNYSFPEAISDYSEALLTSYDFLAVAPINITIPLLSIAYLSPLNEFLKKVGYEPAYIIFLAGITGARKSTLTALLLSHFGKFSSKGLPSSFKDTANSIEKKGFFLKDSLTAIDDYHPSMQKSELSKMEKIAQEITRSYGDRTGRSRMGSDTSLKASYVPRGNLIITGEDIPNIGQSGIARHLILEIKKDDINNEILTELQKNSNQLNLAMRGYIEWLLPQVDELSSKLEHMFLKYRDNARSDTQHARMPETVAWLQIGYDMFLSYAQHLKIVDEQSADNLRIESFNLFMKLAEVQSMAIEDDKPTVKFINSLRELLATGRCYVKDIRDISENENSGSSFIGYSDDKFFYLYGEVTFSEVVTSYKQQGLNFPVSKSTLLKQLEIEKLIEVQVNGNRTYREKPKKIRSEVKRLIWLKKEALLEKEFTNIKHQVI